MSTGILLKSLAPGVLQDANGDALIGRAIYVYEPNTTTQITVYSDSGLTIPVAQPISSDSAGSLDVYVVGGQSADLYDPATNKRTPIYIPHTPETVITDSSETGSSDWSVVKESPLNVQWAEFGAKGDGSTDDAAALNAAIAKAQTNVYPKQGGAVYLPTGAYKHSAPLAVSADNITIFGDGCGNPTGNKNTNGNPQYGGTVLVPTSAVTGQVVKFGLPGTPSRTLNGCFLRDLSLDGSLLPASVHGVFWQVFKGGMDRVYVYKATGDGIHEDGNGSITFPQGAWDNHFWNVTVEGSVGDGWGGVWTSDNTYVGCTSKNNTGHGWHMDANSPSNMWTGCYSNTNLGKGILCDVSMQQKIMATRIQDNNGGVYLVGSNGYGGFQIVGCTIRNPSFSADNTTDGINLSSTISTVGGLISGCGFFCDQGNGNGSAPNFNRARYLINIADSNVKFVTIAPYTQATTGAGGAYGTGPLNDLGSNTQILWAVGPTGLPELKHSGDIRVVTHAGSPEGAVFAGPGSQSYNPSGGAGTSFYVKESGTGSTGWVGK